MQINRKIHTAAHFTQCHCFGHGASVLLYSIQWRITVNIRRGVRGIAYDKYWVHFDPVTVKPWLNKPPRHPGQRNTIAFTITCIKVNYKWSKHQLFQQKTFCSWMYRRLNFQSSIQAIGLLSFSRTEGGWDHVHLTFMMRTRPFNQGQ